jgi:hypothetical protein
MTVAESSWPSPSNGHVVDDVSWEKLAINIGLSGGVYGDFTSPQLIFGDSTGLQVKVAADRYAYVRGHEWWSGSSIVTKAIASNSSGSTRTDLVVLRLSRTTWDVTVQIVQGTPGAGAPSPVQNVGTTGTWDLPLATVTVANSASTIAAGNVTYVAPHLSPDGGGLRVPTEAAAAYIPSPLTGMIAIVTDGTDLRYSGSAWAQKWGWKTWAPTVYQHMLTTRVAVAGTTVNTARYLQQGKLVIAHADISTTTVTTGGVAVSLPVNSSERLIACGAGGIYNTAGAPVNQSGTVSMGPGAPTDNVLFTTFTSAWVDTVTGTNSLRFTVVYEAA